MIAERPRSTSKTLLMRRLSISGHPDRFAVERRNERWLPPRRRWLSVEVAQAVTDKRIRNAKSACDKVSRIRHMVPGGSRESRPKRKVRFADHPEVNDEMLICRHRSVQVQDNLERG